jgi:hypothetical protein
MAGDEGIPNRRAQGGCGAEPAGLTQVIIPSFTSIENIRTCTHCFTVGAACVNFLRVPGFY